MAAEPMIHGAPWKHILKFSFPILAGAVLQQLYTTVDTVIVGNFTGEKALAAVGTTNTLCFFLLAAAIGFSAGNGVLIAQHFGAGRMDLVRRDAVSGLIVLPGLGLFAGVTGIIFSRTAFVHFIAVPEEILDDTLLYFRLYCAGLVFQFGYNVLAAILRSVGDSAATLYFLLFAAVLNVGLDLWFVAYLDWGVAGAARATNISQALSMIAAGYYMHRKYPVFRWRLKEVAPDRNAVAGTLRLGWPIALQMMIVAVGVSFIQRAVNSFGPVMTAAFTVGHRIEMYLHMPCNALMTTLATFTGQNTGAGKMERLPQGAFQGTALSAGFTLLLSVLIWIFAGEIPGWFALGEQAAEYCREYLNATAFILVILSLYVPVFGVFQGTRHALVPTMVALCALTLRVIVTWIFKDSSVFGHSIIWWNGVFGFSLGCLITWIYYFSGLWRRNAREKEL